MLSWLRNNAKIFLSVVVVTFVLLIFIDWGSGRGSGPGQGRPVVAIVGDLELSPQQYQQHYAEVRDRVLTSMQMSGNPHPEGELTALHEEIEEAAFEEMINARLRSIYLDRHGWPALGVEEAEALIIRQMELGGVQDPEAMLSSYREDPRYPQILYQTYEQASSILFPSAVRLGSMASTAELQFYLAESYSTITARYLLFTGEIVMPSDPELTEFYRENQDLFTDPPSATVRYVTVGITPADEDESMAVSTVDSLVLSGARADTVLMTQQQYASFVPDTIEALLEPGRVSPMFRAASLSTAPGLAAWHAIEIDTIMPASTPEASDTLRILHWEAPVYPGRGTVMSAYWDVETEADSLLSSEIPWSDSLIILDWGEIVVNSEMTELRGYPRALLTFAMDSLWTDDTGPIMYIPSYMGGYPALMIARRLDYSPGGLVTLEEARPGGRLILTASSEIQKATSMSQATQALAEIEREGLTLGAYADRESLEIISTPEFTVSDIREAAAMDESAYGGLLSSAEFADVALIAPPLEVLGPFRLGNNAALVEITSRSSVPMPSDPMMNAPVYLTVQSRSSVSDVWSQLQLVRESTEVEDLREQYIAQVQAAKADTTGTEER